MATITNNPNVRGTLAGPKETFGPFNRFAVAPVHTRFDAVEWMVWDAETIDPSLGLSEIIRQAPTKEEAIAGLDTFEDDGLFES